MKGIQPGCPRFRRLYSISRTEAYYCKKSCEFLAKQGLPGQIDLKVKKSALKSASTQYKVPYLLVVGDKEVEAGTLAVRDRTGTDLGVMTIDEFSVLLQQDVDNYSDVLLSQLQTKQ